MLNPAAHRFVLFCVAWTVGLLWLGSVVHATESSLACPDWPTCFGTMFPAMEGGVFWEHLHRLVAGGLILLWIGATAFLWKESGDRRWLRTAGLAGVGLLVVQAVFGGMTVIFRLPAWISSTHLALAYLFLGLAVVVALATGSMWGRVVGDLGPGRLRRLRTDAVLAAGLVFLQSLTGAAVRHLDAGMACGRELLTCRGGVLPGAADAVTLLHFGHRMLGVLVAAWIFWICARAFREAAPVTIRRLHLAAAGLVTLQIGLGLISVRDYLGVVPVSLHTVGAALVFAAQVAVVAHLSAGRTSVAALTPAGGVAVG